MPLILTQQMQLHGQPQEIAAYPVSMETTSLYRSSCPEPELHSTQDIPNVLPVQKQPLDTCVDLIYSHYMATFEDKVDKKICFVVTHWMRAVKS